MTLEVRQLSFRGQSFLFPAVVFRGGCLAFLEDFSVLFLDNGLYVVCAAITNFYVHLFLLKILLYR